MEASRTEKLNWLGVQLVAKLMGVPPRGVRYGFIDGEKKTVRVKVQNPFHAEKFGDSFTIDVDAKGAGVKALNFDRLIFVNYDDPTTIRIYECIDKEKYEMAYVNRGFKGMKGIVVCFPIAGMRLLHEVVDPNTLSEMKACSDARKFNIESTKYARVA